MSSITCTVCDKGFVNPSFGSMNSTACKRCPAGTVTLSKSLNTCSNCPIFTKPRANMYECELEDEAFAMLVAGSAALVLILLCCLGCRAYLWTIRKEREERRAQLDARGAVVELQNIADPTGQQDSTVFKLTYAPPGSQRSFGGGAAATAVVLATENVVIPAVPAVDINGDALGSGRVWGGQQQQQQQQQRPWRQQHEGQTPELVQAQHELDIALGRMDGVMVEVDTGLESTGRVSEARRPQHRGSTWI